MEYTNYTPFPTLCFETIWPDNSEHYTIAIRATAEILPDERLQLAEDQLPLFVTDIYFGQLGSSSLRYPNDLSPFKPKADIIINATAYNPRSPSGTFSASVKIGDIEKTILVTGPIVWEKTFTGWRLTDPEPVTKQPIRYESAFGGAFKYTDEQGQCKIVDLYQCNPVGVGWRSMLADKFDGNTKEMTAPQIYPYSSEILFGKEYPPEGFGAIAPSWMPRRKYAGSWHAPAEGRELPSYPPDFDQLYYNSAHPDLIVPYLKGDEKIELVNLTPGGKLNFQLPGHCIYVTAQYSGSEGETVKVPTRLDTVIIEPDEMRVGMVWRATLPVSEEIEKINTRMTFNEKQAEEKITKEVSA